jgi:hypothetical protein
MGRGWQEHAKEGPMARPLIAAFDNREGIAELDRARDGLRGAMTAARLCGLSARLRLFSKD